MVILIGGVGYAGKTFLAQKLLEKYKFPYLSIDHLKMGMCRANIDCGFTPLDSTEHISEKLWPILKGIIMTNIENEQNLIVEGIYLLPNKINELGDDYLEDVISFYLGFSEEYIEKYFESKITYHRCVINSRGYDNSDTISEYISENKIFKSIYEKNHAKYFEISEDYQKEMEFVHSWIHDCIAGKSPQNITAQII